MHHRAPEGHSGGGKKMQGFNADDINVKVPPGTIVRDVKTGAVLAEMFAHGTQLIRLKPASVNLPPTRAEHPVNSNLTP